MTQDKTSLVTNAKRRDDQGGRVRCDLGPIRLSADDDNSAVGGLQLMLGAIASVISRTCVGLG